MNIDGFKDFVAKALSGGCSMIKKHAGIIAVFIGWFAIFFCLLSFVFVNAPRTERDTLTFKEVEKLKVEVQKLREVIESERGD